MKKILGVWLMMLACASVWAQNFEGYSNRTTVYATYQPARVTLVTGKVVMQKEANVFLKNGRLLFKKDKFDMEADMRQIKSVEFKDRTYVRIDTILATVVDTVGANRIFCTTTIDVEAFNKQRLNDRIISDFQMNDQLVSAASVDPSDEDNLYPLVNTYFLEIDGKVVKAHERVLMRMLPKAKRGRLEFYMQMPDFSWSDKNSLRQVLELFKK
ncbi:MAG: hypothetical protein IJ013_05945 [Bacteroidaceae bacterium]|nr:hypothetical protein [Bacteroidaceae bacterium]